MTDPIQPARRLLGFGLKRIGMAVTSARSFTSPNRRWLVLLLGLNIVLAAGFWLNHENSDDLPDPVMSRNQNAEAQPPNGNIAFAADNTKPTSPAAVNPAKVNAIIECHDEMAMESQIEAFMDAQLGSELIELTRAKAPQWSEQDIPDLQASGDAGNAGVSTVSPHASYSNAILQASADNGDAMSAAVYGARLLVEVQRERATNDFMVRQQKLELSQRYLQQGLTGRVSGVWPFINQLLMAKIATNQRAAASGTMTAADVESATDQYITWLLVQNRFGSFNERMLAHHQLAREKSDKRFSADRMAQAERAAELLVSKLALVVPARSPEELRAEAAAIRFIDKVVAFEPTSNQLRCKDGNRISTELKHEAIQRLAERYNNG